MYLFSIPGTYGYGLYDDIIDDNTAAGKYNK
jgi:hypothetical protein